MKKSRFSEEQIIGALREADAGVRVVEICRKLRISEATLYQWKVKYGGLGISELRRLKELEGGNSRLKRMYAELSLAHHALQDVIQKSKVRAGATGAGRAHGQSTRLIMPTHAPYGAVARLSVYRVGESKDDTPVIEAVLEHFEREPGQRFDKLYAAFRANRDRYPWGKTRLWRVYCDLRLNLKRRGRRRGTCNPCCRHSRKVRSALMRQPSRSKNTQIRR